MARWDTKLQARLHRPTAEARDRTIAALYRFARPHDTENQTPETQAAAKLAGKLCECGRHATIYIDQESGELITSTARCKSRVCPRCASIRAIRVRDSISEAAKGLNSPRFMTLTPKHSDEPLRAQLDHLRASYTRLRRSKAWKAHVDGAIAVVEVKWSQGDRRWHPHLHIIADGRYWAQAMLSECWKVASGGARIVDIRMIHSRKEVARYVAKYVTDTGKNANIPPHKLPEYALALHGFRLISTCGTLHGQVKETDKKRPGVKLDHLAHFGALAEDALSGNNRAARLWRGLGLVVQIQRAAGPDGLSPRDQRRRGKITRQLRRGWKLTERLDHRGNPKRSIHRPRSRGPDHRSLRLWQEPDAAATATTVGPRR